MAKRKHKTNSQRSDGVKGEGEYWAEAILDWGVHDNGIMMYLVKWEGYDEVDNSWEFQQNVMSCEQLLTDFHINLINGRHPPKCSFDEYDKLFRYLIDLVQNKDSKHFEDFAVLRKLSKRDIDCFEIRTDDVIKEIKDEIQSQLNLMNEMNTKFKSRSNAERIVAREVVSSVVQSLSILKNFGSITHFFEFVDKRVTVLRRLKKWQKRHNKTIVSQREGRPIKVVNDVDFEIPDLMTYITEYMIDEQFGKDMKLEDEEPLVGCQCTNCYECRDECCTAIIGFPFVYNSKGLLKTQPFHQIIYECNSKCMCDENCPNRQIQRGRPFDLEIFRTDSKVRGWGVRTLQVIPKGAFITQYTGEVISILEAEKRPTTYLFDLSAHLDPSDVEFTYVVDASKYGNITRFVNHSCAPNCRVLFTWIKRSTNKLLPMIALFAERQIRPNEELTYDYSMELIDYSDQSFHIKSFLSDISNELSASEDERSDTSSSTVNVQTISSRKRAERKVSFAKIRCECGAVNCKKYLYS